MQKTLNKDNFYTFEINIAEVSDLAFKSHKPQIYNSNCLEVSADLRFCKRCRVEDSIEEGYSYYSKIYDEIFPNSKDIPDKPIAIKTTVVAIKKEYFNNGK